MARKTHYDTLGVPRNATMEEIKSAFRQLSKETHPDVAGASANAERFKQISNAASVLTNKTKKEAYDMKLSHPLGGHHGGWQQQPGGAAAAAARRAEGPRATNGFQAFILTVFRPRNMVLGSIAVYTTVTTARYLFDLNDKPLATPNKPMVQAWKNPQTGEWEQPAPWDPTYRRLKPRLTFVPRDEVKTRTR